MAFWRKIADKLTSHAREYSAPERPTELIYIMLPEPLQPLDRGSRYEDPLEVELILADLGFVSGGGSSLSDERADRSREIEFCGIDVEAYEVAAVRALLRAQLPELGCLPGTQLHYRDEAEAPLLDEYDGIEWRLDLPRTMMHPGFGV